jgi:hypothetical protein
VQLALFGTRGDEDGEPGRWRELITEGHVRAARLRRLQPSFVTIGLGAMLIGFFLAANFQPKESLDRGEPTADTIVAAAKRPAIQAMANLPALTIQGDDIKPLVASSEASQLAATILAGLASTGSLPHDPPPMKPMTPADFWSGDWPIDALPVTETRNLKLVGAIFKTPVQGVYQPVRWIGVFEKRGGQWKFLSLKAPGFFVIAGQPTAKAEDIPVTLRPLLPPAAPTPAPATEQAPSNG